MDIMKDIRARLANIRAAGISDRKLGALAGVSDRTIWNIRNGKHSPTVSKLDAINAALSKLEGEVTT